MWWTLYGQLEGRFFNEDGTELIMDAKALEALELMAKLAADGLVPRSANYLALVAQFTSGDVGLSFNGEGGDDVPDREDAVQHGAVPGRVRRAEYAPVTRTRS